MFGIKGSVGDLILKPKLTKQQFDDGGRVHASTVFLGEKIEVIYNNPLKLNYEEYKIIKIELNGNDINYEKIDNKTVKLEKSYLEVSLSEGNINKIEVFLDK